jgi:hypothetical protein
VERDIEAEVLFKGVLMFGLKVMAAALMAMGWAMLAWSLGGAPLWAATPSDTCCIPAKVLAPTVPKGCDNVADGQGGGYCVVDTSWPVPCQGQFSDTLVASNNCTRAYVGLDCIAGSGIFTLSQYTARCNPNNWPNCKCELVKGMGNPTPLTPTCTAGATSYCP